jgi:hypothetical protein
MGWNSQSSRRRPWPYDAYISKTRVMLQPGADGNLVGTKSKTLDQIAPVNYEYGSSNPFLERTEAWNQLYGGLGETVQPETRPRRYMYATRADLSVDGYWMKGPNFENHVETIGPGSGEVRQFVKALFGGQETVFALCQNGIYYRSADGVWVASLTTGTTPALPVLTYPQQGVRFKARGLALDTGVAPLDCLYVAMSAGNIWRFNGTTWAVAVPTQGPLNPITAADGQARYIERVGDELWVAGDYWVVKVEEDPMDRTKYAGAIYIGDQVSKVTYLKALDNTLYIWKTDGLYTISTAGVDQDLFPSLRGKTSPYNGRNAAVWMNRLWFSFLDDTYTIDANGQISPDGLEQMLENISDVRGRLVGGAGHNTWFFYEVYYNPQVNRTYLIKHGTWVEQNDIAGSIHFADAHHGSLAEWFKQATCVQILSNLHPQGNDRLYVGFADGTVEWCVLPQASPNPSTDPYTEYTFQDSYVYLPVHHANFQADNKFWRGISIFGPHVTNYEFCEVEYRYDLINDTADWFLLDPDNSRFTLPGMRHDFPTLNPIYSKSIALRVKLAKNPTLSPINATPVIDGINVHEAIRPAVSLQYVMSIMATSFQPKHSGVVDRRRGTSIREELYTVATQIGAILIRLDDGRAQEVVCIDYKESKIPKQKSRAAGHTIQMSFLQLQALTNIAVESGITYGTLETYTLGELEDLL